VIIGSALEVLGVHVHRAARGLGRHLGLLAHQLEGVGPDLGLDLLRQLGVVLEVFLS